MTNTYQDTYFSVLHHHYYDLMDGEHKHSRDSSSSSSRRRRTPQEEYNPYGSVTPTPTTTEKKLPITSNDGCHGWDALSGNNMVTYWPSSLEEEVGTFPDIGDDDLIESKQEEHYFSYQNHNPIHTLRYRKAIHFPLNPPATAIISSTIHDKPANLPLITATKTENLQQQQQAQVQPSSQSSSTTTTTTTIDTTNYRERLDEAKRHVMVLESNVALYKQLAQLEEDFQTRTFQLDDLQQQVRRLVKHSQHQEQELKRLQQLQQHQQPERQKQQETSKEEWDTSMVTWKISRFERKLTSERSYFQSSPFAVGWYASFYLMVCILEVADTVPESKRPVAIFLKANDAVDHHKQQRQRQEQQQKQKHPRPHDSSIFPIRLDGSKITLVSNKNNSSASDKLEDKTVQVGQTQMEDASQGKGIRQLTTLGEMRDSFIQDDGSVVFRATVRVPRVPKYRVKTIL